MRHLTCVAALSFWTLAVPPTVHADAPPTDFRPAFAEACKRGDKRIVIPPGTYRLAPEGKQGVVWTITGLRDREVVAEGVVLVCTRLTRAVAFEGCEGVTVRGLTVDYDPLPFTQGTVTAVAEDWSAIDVRLHAGYPHHPYARIDVVDPKTRRRKKGMPFLWGTKARMLGPDTVRVSLKDIGKAAAVGDLVSLSTGPEPGGIPHAVSLERCTGVTLREVTVHSAPGMGILESDGMGKSRYLGCRVVPGPPPVGATESRLLSTSWDAMQTKTVRVGPLVDGCEIRDAGDDSWSVQSSDFLVLKREGRELVVASRDEYTAGLEATDRLKSRVDGPEAAVQAVRTVAREKAGLEDDILTKLADAKPWSEWKVSSRCLAITLDRELPVKAGDSLYSPDRMGNGFAFVNNRVFSPGRVLVKAAGRIEGNLLDAPHGMVVCPELPAAAAAGIDGLTVRDNTIRHAGWFCPAPWSSQAGALSVTAAGRPPDLRPAGVFANVLIERNTFEECSGPNVVVSSTRGLVIRDNRFVRPHHDRPPTTGDVHKIASDAVVWVADSEDVTIHDNKVLEVGHFAGKEIQFGKDVRGLRERP